MGSLLFWKSRTRDSLRHGRMGEFPALGGHTGAACALLISLFAAVALAQDPVLSVSTTEVIVPVTVTDANGKFVSNLEKKDFKIYDEGKLQDLTYFSRERSRMTRVTAAT